MSQHRLQRLRATIQGCELAGVNYHRVDTKDIPSGWASVPVAVGDNKRAIRIRMMAGSVAIEARSSSTVKSGEDIDQSRGSLALDSIQPAAGWWIIEPNE